MSAVASSQVEGPPRGPGQDAPRESSRASAPRRPVIPFPAALAVVLGSTLALLVLAGVPIAGGGAGDVVRGLVLLFFWLVVPGTVVVDRVRLQPLTRLATAPLVGLGLLVAVGTVGSVTGSWTPRGSAAAVAAAACAVTLLDIRAGRVRPVALPRARPRRVTVGLLVSLAGCIALWATSIPAITSAHPSVLGLLVAGPRTFPLALLATVVVLVVALRAGSVTAVWGAALTVLLLVRSTAPIASPVPHAAWTYKHLGVVAALQQHHHVAAGTDIYMNWPGMFAAGAYFSDSTGVAPIDLARWFPLLVNVLLALSTAALAQVYGARAAGCAAAAALVVAVDWVGQDYFSPQAVALCLGAGVVVLLVQSSASRVCGVLAAALFCPIVVSHQLTPPWLVALAVALVVLRRAAWWVAAAMVVVLAAYLATRWPVVQAYGPFSGFDPIANAAGNVPDVPALGREVGGYFAKASSLLMWTSTAAVLLHRWVRLGLSTGWRSPEVVVPAAVAFSSFVLLAGQSYGGEAILRVTLYSTLGCAAVLGPSLATALRRRPLTALAAAVWTVVVVACTAQSSFVLWSVDLIQPEDVEAARWLVDQNPNADVVPVIAAWPGRTSVDYERFIGPYTTLEPGLDDLLRDEVPVGSSNPLGPVAVSADRVTAIALGREPRSTYVVFTGNMRAYDAYYATYPPGGYEATLDALVASPDWALVRHQGDLWVLLHRGTPAPTG